MNAVRNSAQQGFLGRRIKSEAADRGGAGVWKAHRKIEQECQTTLGNLHLAIRASEVEPIKSGQLGSGTVAGALASAHAWRPGLLHARPTTRQLRPPHPGPHLDLLIDAGDRTFFDGWWWAVLRNRPSKHQFPA